MSLSTAPCTTPTRIRITCLSDTHCTNQPIIPRGSDTDTESTSILIHAGDLTRTGTLTELRRTLTYLSSAPGYAAKIIVAGNHDVTLDGVFYAQYGNYFHHKKPQDAAACLDLVRNWPGITHLEHESTTIDIPTRDERSRKLKIFGSPYSPARNLWAFSYAPESAAGLWSAIPLDADIVVTHTPPRYHRDESGTGRGAAGCEALRQALWRVRPKLVVCGHIHEGRGADVVEWDLGTANVRFKEVGVRGVGVVEGEGVVRVDLGGLRNDGARGDWVSGEGEWKGRGTEVVDVDVDADVEVEVEAGIDNEAGADVDAEADANTGLDGSTDPPRKDKGKGKAKVERKIPPTPPTLPPIPPRSSRHKSQHPFPNFGTAKLPIPLVPAAANPHDLHLSTRGQGGLEGSGRCDREALEGRRGRVETCVVNAAVVGGVGGWCVKGKGGGSGSGVKKGEINRRERGGGGGVFVVEIEVVRWEDKGADEEQAERAALNGEAEQATETEMAGIDEVRNEAEAVASTLDAAAVVE